MAELIKVLDHGYVRLIDSMGSDETIIEAARMSTGKGFERWDPGDVCTVCGETPDHQEQTRIKTVCYAGKEHTWKTVPGDAKLLSFLYQNRHHTPFEMCEMAIECQWPIMVGREAMRHRVFGFNEFSGRYAQMPNLHYLPELERFQKQSATNRQGSAEPLLPDVAHDMLASFENEQRIVYENYDRFVTQGLAKEVARLNTPVSRYTKVRMKGDLRGWLGFLALRLPANAQWEIRQYAQVISGLVMSLWPRTHALFTEHTLNAVTLSQTEMTVLRQMLEPARELGGDRTERARLLTKLGVTP